MAKFHRADSFLKNTGVYDIFLDVSKMPSVPKNVQDEKYIIEAKYFGKIISHIITITSEISIAN